MTNINNKGICKLCQNEKELMESHIVPSFAFRWLKKTSATGFLRTVLEANKRVEDGRKQKLLCKECEHIFNKSETQFANKVYYPYVEKELDAAGVAQGIIKEIQYEDWLLRFIISVHWRLIVARSSGTESKIL